MIESAPLYLTSLLKASTRINIMSPNKDELLQRAENLSDDELIKQVTLNAREYREDYLAIARGVLERRGYKLGEGEDPKIITPTGAKILKVKPEAPAPSFRRPKRDLEGIGWWLSLFILGQLIGRPLQLWNGILEFQLLPDNIASVFPETITMMYIELGLMSFLTLFGVVVAILLLIYNPLAVKITKIFLITYIVAMFLNMILGGYMDLPSDLKEQIQQKMAIKLWLSVFWSTVWYLYFTKSKRVKANYD